MEQYQRQHSLWNLIKQYVPDSELAEVRSLIGEALIDVYTDLYSEVELWEQIWRDSTQQWNRPNSTPSPLADPPAIKALLKAEIQLLLLSVRERAAREGRDGDAVLSRYSPSVVSYVLSNGPKTPRSTPENRDTPSRSQSRQSQNGNRSSSQLSSVSSLEDEIESVKMKLNVSHVDDVVSHLQSVLVEDCEALKKDVQFLQEDVERAHHTDHTDGELPEPTVTELKEQRKVIQMDLQRQPLTSGSFSPDKAASKGPLARSRQRTGCRANHLGKYHNPTPLSATAAAMTLPRPPSSQDLAHCTPGAQPSTPHPDRTPGLPPTPDSSAPLPGPVPLEVPERLGERGCSPDTLLPCLRLGGSRSREPRLLPLSTSPLTSSSELHVVVREGRQDTLPANALACDGQNLLSQRSGSDVHQPCTGASILPLPAARGVLEGRPAKRLSLDGLVPCPPAAQKPANRGQSVARRLGHSQMDRLVSPS